MSQQDPTSVEAPSDEFGFGEISVDDLAASEAIEAGTNDPTQPVEAKLNPRE